MTRSQKMKISPLIFTLLIVACSPSQRESSTEDARSPGPRVELETTKGKIVLQLYNKTPKHRDNFLGLVEEGVFDSVLFHRVINDFVIQAGDPESKYATSSDTLGGGGPEYRVPAEFDTTLFHKRGALGAARDGNPERASSATQFYIVQRGPRADSLIDIDEERINGWLADNRALNAPENSALKEALLQAEEASDRDLYLEINDSLRKISESYNSPRYVIPEAHREIYRTVGGTPHLDQNYTVFGHVIEGMAVVDSIAAVPVNDLDRPVEDVRILSARVIR